MLAQIDHQIATGADDDVLCLLAVEMHWRPLAGQSDHQLLAVRLGPTLTGRVAIAAGEERQAVVAKVAKTKVGDVPAETTLSDLVALGTLTHPVFWRPVAKRWQDDLMLNQHFLRPCQDFINLRAFHCSAPPLSTFFLLSASIY